MYNQTILQKYKKIKKKKEKKYKKRKKIIKTKKKKNLLIKFSQHESLHSEWLAIITSVLLFTYLLCFALNRMYSVYIILSSLNVTMKIIMFFTLKNCNVQFAAIVG